jgi:hypothetical protein
MRLLSVFHHSIRDGILYHPGQQAGDPLVGKRRSLAARFPVFANPNTVTTTTILISFFLPFHSLLLHQFVSRSVFAI